jgi:mannose-6-phosphate isomerase-like protein (cupin superfamily)
MRAGDVIVDGAETFTVTRSAADGDRFHFDLELAPGAVGPPLHTHEEPESFDILSGTIVFSLDGVDRSFSAGESFTIRPGCVHTFRNPSKSEVLRARATHGSRFERLVDQLAAGGPRFSRLSLSLHTVDPRASYMVSPFVRAMMRVAAWLALARGVTLVPPTGKYGPPEMVAGVGVGD